MSITNVENIRDRVDFEDMLGRYGIDVSGPASRRVAECQNHSDTHPSMQVSSGRHQAFRCWVCGFRGDVFDFASHMDGISDFPKIVKHVAEMFGIEVIEDANKVDPKILQERRDEQRALTDIYSQAEEIRSIAVDIFHMALMNDPFRLEHLIGEAVGYRLQAVGSEKEKKQIHHRGRMPQIIAREKVGIAVTDDLGKLVWNELRKRYGDKLKDGFDRAAFLASGLFMPGNGYGRTSDNVRTDKTGRKLQAFFRDGYLYPQYGRSKRQDAPAPVICISRKCWPEDKRDKTKQYQSTSQVYIKVPGLNDKRIVQCDTDGTNPFERWLNPRDLKCLYLIIGEGEDDILSIMEAFKGGDKNLWKRWGVVGFRGTPSAAQMDILVKERGGRLTVLLFDADGQPLKGVLRGGVKYTQDIGLKLLESGSTPENVQSIVWTRATDWQAGDFVKDIDELMRRESSLGARSDLLTKVIDEYCVDIVEWTIERAENACFEVEFELDKLEDALNDGNRISDND